MDSLESLSQIPIFQKLAKESLEKISHLIETVRFPDGATIFSEGSSDDSLYIVAQGEVLILKALVKTPSGRARHSLENIEKVVATLQKGDFFGEMALLEDVRRSASARAKGEALVLRIKRESFWNFVKSDAANALQAIIPLTRTMSERLRQTTLEFATVYELGKIFSSGLSQKELAAQIVDQVKTVIPEGSLAALALWNEFNDEFEWVTITHPDEFPHELRRTLSRSESLPKFLEEQKTYLLSENWQAESRFSPEEKVLYGRETSALLAVPLFKSQNTKLLASGRGMVFSSLLGFFFCMSRGKSVLKDESAREAAPVGVSPPVLFDRQLIQLLTTIAQLSAIALENSALREEEMARTRYAQQRQSVY